MEPFRGLGDSRGGGGGIRASDVFPARGRGGRGGGGGAGGGGGGGMGAAEVFPAVGLGPPRREQEVGQDALFVA